MEFTLNNHNVAITHTPETGAYPNFPYNPPEKYPEFESSDIDEKNVIYSQVRQVILDLGLDSKNYGSPNWNPLGEFIKPGQRVLLKPNWVRNFNPIDPNIDSLITHTSIIRPIIDYTILALQGKGQITIADAPLQSCNFEKLIEICRIGDLLFLYRKKYPNISFELIDLRKTILTKSGIANGMPGTAVQDTQNGDPRGYSLIDLGEHSLLTDISDKHELFRVTNYNHKLLHEHHNLEKNEYFVANSILLADVVINLPKMKCHIKAGITGALKNLVGMNGHKEYLPHHVNGSFFDGGDQYIYKSKIKEIFNKIYDAYWSEHQNQGRLKNKYQEYSMLFLSVLSRIIDKDKNLDGGWYGNETIPRTTLDLNHILYFYDLKTKSLRDKPIRTVLSLIDGIVAGDNKGPLRPESKPSGVLIASFNPLLADLVMAKMIGYQPLRLKTLFLGIYHIKSRFSLTLGTPGVIKVSYNSQPQTLAELPNLNFTIPEYWEQAAENHQQPQ